jgi:hypothetical protein
MSLDKGRSVTEIFWNRLSNPSGKPEHSGYDESGILPAAKNGEELFLDARIDGFFGEFAGGFDGETNLIDVNLAPIAFSDVHFEAPLIYRRQGALEIVGHKFD